MSSAVAAAAGSGPAGGDERPRLVFACRRTPWPLDSGARIRTNRLLSGLAESFDTALVTFEHHPDSPEGHCSPEELRAALPGVEVVTVPGLGPGKRRAQLFSLVRPQSWEFGRFRLPALQRALAETIVRRRPGLVHLDDPAVAPLAPLGGPALAYAPHNVEHQILRGVAAASSGPRRAFAELEWRKLAREERRLWRTMPLCLAVSELDAEAMRAGGAARVELCPNGTDPAPFAPPRRRSGEPLRLLFVGSANYEPYRLGLEWLIAEVLPRVREQMPAELDIVGGPPKRRLEAPGVRWAGTVESVAHWYQAAHVAVVPVFQGSGTRLKVVEAMAYGRPVVSTRLGAEGLPVRPGEHYLESDEPDGFARALIRVGEDCAAGDGELPGRLERAREAIEPLFWPRIVAALAELYRAEMAGSGRSAVSTAA